MRRHKSSIWAAMFLLMVCGALVWAISRQLAVAPSLEARAHGSTVAATEVPELSPKVQFSMSPIEYFQAILERPLFSPSGRPSLVESVALPTTTTKVTFVLKGILIDGNKRVALFRSKKTDKAVRLREGDRMEGWTLVRIGVDHVALARGEIETVLQPSFEQSL